MSERFAMFLALAVFWNVGAVFVAFAARRRPERLAPLLRGEDHRPGTAAPWLRNPGG